MDKLHTVILIAHTLIAFVIIVLVLLQRGKGADAGAAFGSGASGTVFGARGSGSFFSRMTAILATVFFASSLALAYLSGQRSEGPDSLLENAPAVETEPADQAPEAGPDAGPEALPDLPTLDDTDDDAATSEDLPTLPEGDAEDEGQ